MSRNTHCDWLWLLITVVVATGVEGQQGAAVRQLTFRYGGGTPGDAGRLGHCTATLFQRWEGQD